MKRLTRIVCLLLAAVLLVGCGRTGNSDTKATAPDFSGAAVGYSEGTAQRSRQAVNYYRSLGQGTDDNYRTWYEIFVYSFCDSDGDGIGDLQGVISKLDYLQDLGINGIWLMPIHPSVSYHKYDVSDYYAIDPQYGTMEDFDALMEECRKRDIHVILDLVLNHTGSEHPWFRQAYEYLQSLAPGQEPNAMVCPYVDYYFFDRGSVPGYYSEVTGTEWSYEARFFYGMPDLNLENKSVRREIRGIMQFWLDKGVSGFRLDAAKEYYSGETQRNCQILRFLMDTLLEMKPDAYMVAEVWDSFTTIADYYDSGIISIFNFPFGDGSGKIPTVLRGLGQPNVVNTYATALEKADRAYSASNPDYIDAPFLSNHDTGRIYGFCSGDEYKIKLAAAMNLFMSGSAFIYYGEELGMPGSGNDPSKRAPMYWNDARNNGTTGLPPECVLPDSYPFGSLETQYAQDSSVFNYYREAIAIRQAFPAISHGKTTAETSLNVGCVSAQRKVWGDQECIILMNIDANAASVDLSAYTEFAPAASLTATGEQPIVKGNTLILPAYGVVVLIKGA